MEALKLLTRLAVVLFLLAGGTAQAQTLSEPEEWSARIKKAESLGTLGTDLFGESTNYTNGQTTFSATDIDLPGNNGLPVRLVRKLGANQSLSDNAQLLGNWDLDLPYMSGIYAAGQGWKSGSGNYARCSGGLAAPSVTVQGELFWGQTYWRNITMHLPGAGTQTVLYPDPANNQRPIDGKTTRYVTANFTQFRCLSQIANPSGEAGFTGEGFEALTPDGTTYTFNWMTRQYFTPMWRQHGTATFNLQREEIRLYATRVQDHRGNWVQYSYSGNRPTSITSSDGRSIALSYDSAGHLKTATAAGRSWQYAYTAESVTAPLTGVTLPDGSAWTLSGSIPKQVIHSLPPGYTPSCGYLGGIYQPQSATITITHPSGATGQFVLAPLRRARYLAGYGSNAACDDNTDPNTRFVVPNVTDNFALVSKTISGPGIATPYVWNMSYSAWDVSQPTQWTQVTNPDGSLDKKTYGSHWYVDEGKLLRSETYAPSGTLLRDEATTYATGAAAGPYPYTVGDTGWADTEDAFADTHIVPSTRSVITQAGDTYTTAVNSFDAFARKLSVTASNSFGGSRTDVTAYYDNTNYWLLGQLRSLTNSNTGLVASLANYGTTSARPEALYAFGLLQMTATYNSDGTLGTLTDGLNRSTTFSQWKRGIPQGITYADNASASASVNDSSWITAITDPRGATTNYGYDSAGRISGITYPTGDTVSWSARNIGYSVLTSSELGIPAGSWRARVTHGRHQISSYYDALLRPVLVEDKDTLSGVTVYTKKAFDHDGQVTFASYPSSSSNPSSGLTTTYDALGRVTRSATTDGITLSTVAYLSGNRKQVTDADGKLTTISYQAFGSPEYKAATLIQSPEGQTTTIARDVFGKSTSISQSGLYSGSSLSASRSFTYDSYQRPCRRMDPESGSTVWGYDAASQVIWEAKGQSGSGCLSSAPSGATLYSYDARKRKTLDDYPGTAEDVTYGYDAASNLTSIANAASTWSYSYNKRNLLETEQAVMDGKTWLLDPSYDNLGTLTSLTTPARTISYSPNAFGQPTQVASDSAYASNLQYWPNGLINSYSLGNGLNYSQTLDTRLRPQVQQTANGTTPIQRFVYGYNNSGDLLSMDDTVDHTDDLSASYDDLHRLKTATGIWGSYSYSYDPLNNLRTRNLNSATNLSYSYTSSNNLLTAISGNQTRSYNYNAKGEITGDGNKSFTLNSLGQISEIIGIATYSYDGNGRRIKTVKGSVTEVSLYDHSGALVYTESLNSAGPGNSTITTQTDYLGLGKQAIAEAVSVTTVTPLAGLPASICTTAPALCTSSTSSTTKYLHADLLGSPRKATDASGNLLWQEHYDPYGQKMNGVSEKLGYTGHAYDPESGFTYMQARFYDPLVGRFLSTDPVYFKDENPFTFNRYAYADNNPYKYTDPTGMGPDDTIAKQARNTGTNTGQENLKRAAYRPTATGTRVPGATPASPVSCSGNCAGFNSAANGGGDGGAPLAKPEPATGSGWVRPDDHAYTVGRPGNDFVAPGKGIGKALDDYGPAFHTFGSNHDNAVAWLRSLGLPDLLVNIPSMPVVFAFSVIQESVNTPTYLINAIGGTDFQAPWQHTDPPD